MQTNEIVGQGQNGTRRPDMDRTFNEVRATLETWAGRRDADESRRTGTKVAEMTRMPCRYGAGF